MSNKNSALRGIRFAVTAVVSLALALAGAKYAIVQPITKNVETITLKKTCQLVWDDRSYDELLGLDPECAKVLK